MKVQYDNMSFSLQNICRLPKLLAIQLKRFEILPSGKTKKIRDIITFPAELDLSAFCQLSAVNPSRTQHDAISSFHYLAA